MGRRHRLRGIEDSSDPCAARPHVFGRARGARISWGRKVLSGESWLLSDEHHKTQTRRGRLRRTTNAARGRDEPRGAAALREALERHSYAIVALDAADALAVRHCAAAGLAYFKTPEATKRTHRHVFSDAGGAGLCGWNKPHAAKEVLRLRRGGPPAPVAAAAAFDVVERCACAAWCAVASLVPEHVDFRRWAAASGTAAPRCRAVRST